MDGLGTVTATILLMAMVAVFCTGALYLAKTASGGYHHQKVLAACEKELPRNKHCILQAVPAPEDETK